MGRYRFWFQVVFAILPLVAGPCVQADEGSPDDRWIDLLSRISVSDNAVQGSWTKQNDQLSVRAGSGARLALPVKLAPEYDFRVQFTRHSGSDSIALIFVAGGKQSVFDIDGWGQHFAGIQLIAGRDMRQYADRVARVTLENDRRYTGLVEVRATRVRTLLDGRVLHEHQTNGTDLSLVPLWRLPDQQALGLGAWNADTTFHRVEYREVPPSPDAVAASPNVAATPPMNRTLPRSAGTSSTRKSGRAKRVLLVIANRHFFYREYSHPREELERAGINVTVAAGHRTECIPHQGSGEGRDGGRVMPDVTLAQVNPDDFDAIVFSGGWGSSMYQYAFDGRYSDPSYNGNRQVKEAANRLIGEFSKKNKFVGGICHGVSVLAWARVDGRSPLAGHRAVAPQRSGPSGVYNGQQAQPPSRWNAEQNGARLAPARSVGGPSPQDDVVVDGRIITAEDDQAARHFGVVLARLLNSGS